MLGEDIKPTIVISGINMMDGGALSIISECLRYLDSNLSNRYHIVALVHKKALFQTEKIHFIEFPDSKSSWFKRVNYEYVKFLKLSQELNPYLWLSLHDITPKVKAEVQAVYCHNPAPFYSPGFKTLLYEPKLLAFKAFYKYLYKINIQKNDFVIVQQNWLRKKFVEQFNVKNVVVANPVNSILPTGGTKTKHVDKQKKTFFYPSFPRIFKNFEVVLEASRLLKKRGYDNYEILFTLSGNENRYASFLYDKYKNDSAIVWCGLLTRNEVLNIFSEIDCMLFMSKLETWGLPITECRAYNKPMILPDLSYAKETAAGYSKVKFIDPENAKTLADSMEDLINNRLEFDTPSHGFGATTELDVRGWEELFALLLRKK